jgi:hypothetical protein
MRVLALTSDLVRRILADAGGRDFSVQHVTTAAGLIRALYADAWSIVVLDPTLLRDDELESVADLSRCGAHSLLLCTPFSRASARCAVMFARRATIDIHFTDLAIEQRLLALKLRALRPQSACGLFLHSISETVNKLPVRISSAIVRMFGTMPLRGKVSEILTTPPTVRRTLDRRLQGAGFRSARVLLEAIRVTWAWDTLRLPDNFSVGRAASDCGYASAHELWVHSQRLLARPPSVLARTAPSASEMETLLDKVLLTRAV